MTKTEIFSQNLEPSELQTLPIIKHTTVKHGSGIIMLFHSSSDRVTGSSWGNVFEDAHNMRLRHAFNITMKGWFPDVYDCP